MPTASSSQTDYVKALPLTDTDTFDRQLAGRGNMLEAARPAQRRAATALRNLLNGAPTVKQTLQATLHAHLGIDPYTCGLQDGDSQVTLMTFAARLLASPLFATAYTTWTTWGLDDSQAQTKWAGSDWLSELGPVVNAAHFQATHDYWNGRMPGTTLSRQKHASNLLRQHFKSNLDMAFGTGKLDIDNWQQGHQPDLQYAQLDCQLPNGASLTSTAALLIAPQPKGSRWLMYRPGAQIPLLTFDNQQSLRNWVHQNHFWFWSDPRYSITTGSNENVIVSPIANDGFSVLLDEHLLRIQAISDHFLFKASKEPATQPLAWSDLQDWEAQRGSIISDSLDATTDNTIDDLIAADAALANEELHFDSLEQYLPTSWRRQRIERQEALLEQYLGDDTEPSSVEVTWLREQLEQLVKLQDSLNLFLLELPDQVAADDWQAPHEEQTRIARISHELSQGLLLEARLQHAMGELSATHLGWVEALVDRPRPSLQRPVQASTLMLGTGDRSWALSGYMTFRAAVGDTDDTLDYSLLLYRPGQQGGLMAFEDEATLTRHLLATLCGAWPDAILDSVHAADAVQLLEALSNAPAVTLDQTPIPAHFMQHCVQTIVESLPANTSREQARQRLCMSENQARAIALERFAELNRSSRVQTLLMPLQHLGADELTELIAQVSAYQDAVRAAGELLKVSLPSRQQFTWHMLEHHVCNEFGLQTMPNITLNIANSVTVKKQVTGQSAAGGAGSRDVPVFSEARSDVSLESFILVALDDERRLLLDNAIITLDPATHPTLQQALTPAYIAELITRLDAAGSYENRIVNAYLGFEQETPWQVEWRHETLRAPYAYRLRLLALCKPASLDADGQRLLETFCREQVNAVSARTVQYLSLVLRPGTAADGSSDSVGLSAIHVITDANGPVLLYMPGAPNGSVVSQHASTSAACEALQRMALDPKMARYLATQAQSGNPDHHESYINTALQQGFRVFIEMGASRSETLPTHECRQDMGDLIRSHRATSRSQADMVLAAPDVFDRYFFLGLRLVLGLLPGAGTALALYDGWHTANAAITAFAKGNLETGIQHLVSLLQSLTDAILTLAPLAASQRNPATAARLLTQRRQRLDPLRPITSTRKAPPSPFTGYEAGLPAGPMVRSTLPQGAGVFEHVATGQRYISRNNAWYAVTWDPAYFTWRLKPQGLRTYRQPVRLSEQGVWGTPGRLSGLLVDNGLAGGGGVLTTLYENGVAYWRVLLRRQPQQLTGMALAHDINDELKRIVIRMRAKQEAYHSAKRVVAEGGALSDAQQAVIANARQQLSDELMQNIEFNARSLARLKEQRSTLSRSDYTRFTSLCEANISEMSVLDMHLVADRFTLATQQSMRATSAIQALPLPSVPTHVVRRVTQDSLRANQEMIETLQEVERLAIGHHARCNQLQGKALTDYLAKVTGTGLTLDVANTRLVRASILSSTLFTANAVEHPQMAAFMAHFNEQGAALRSTLFSHLQLQKAGLSRAQERTFLASVQDRYTRFIGHVTAWQDTFQDLLSTNETRSLRQLMRQLVSDIEDSLNSVTANRQRPAVQPARGPSRPRLFETAEGPLIGNEYVERGQTRMRINHPNSDQPHTVYARNEAGEWLLSTPERAAPTETMSSLVETATARLDDIPRQQTRLRQYQTPQAVPVDLEDIAQGHAQQLRFIADRIRQKAGGTLNPEQTALTHRLETTAQQVQAFGRQLRTAQTKATGKPTVGYLEDLLEQNEVEIVWSRTLKPKTDRKGNPVEYLEEYRINDLGTQQPLWYAHFHFRQQPAQGFTRLEAGHLKLASERDIGEGAWRGSMSEAQANRLFGNLRPAS